MAQGAQNGLNQNNDLGDQIAEYSVYWAKMGFSAEEMFNSLVSGAENGAYQIDYLNDVMKEFGIRSKDNSDLSSEAFEALGLDAEEMFEIFANGGDDSVEAFSLIVNELSEMEDKVAQNEIGVGLFGTKWEDLEASAVLALGNIQGDISLTSNALEEMNNVKYDDLEAQFDGIKRKFETSIMIPIGEQILPIASGLLECLSNMLDGFLETVAWVGAVCSDETTAIGETVALIREVIESILDGIMFFASLWCDLFTQLWAELGGPIISLVTTAFNNIKIAIDTTLESILGIFNIFKAILQGDWDEALNMLVDSVINVGENVIEFFTNIIDFILDIVRGVAPDLYDAGTEMFTKFWDGLKDVWGNISSWVTSKVSEVVDKLTFWNNSSSSVSVSSGGGTAWAVAVDGSHRTGLDYVPYDNYVALLHQGEMVLTSSEASRYSTSSVNSVSSISIGSSTSESTGISSIIGSWNDIFGNLAVGTKEMLAELEVYLIESIARIVSRTEIAEQMAEISRLASEKSAQAAEIAMQAAISAAQAAAQSAANAAASAAQSAANASRAISGSHRTGLDYVPYDNYLAVLHQGERVLTQAENRRYETNQNTTHEGDLIINIDKIENSNGRNAQDFLREAEYYRQAKTRGKGGK